VPAGVGRAAVVAAVLGLAAWAVVSGLDPQGRLATAAVLVVVGGVGTAAYAAAVRRLGALPPPLPAA
jgi:hypothetical protein